MTTPDRLAPLTREEFQSHTLFEDEGWNGQFFRVVFNVTDDIAVSMSWHDAFELVVCSIVPMLERHFERYIIGHSDPATGALDVEFTFDSDQYSKDLASAAKEFLNRGGHNQQVLRE